MLGKTDKSAVGFVVAALVFFFIGGLLTTVVPPLVDKSWSKPFENNDPSKGPTGQARPYTELRTQRARDLRPRRMLVLPHATDSHPAR